MMLQTRLPSRGAPAARGRCVPALRGATRCRSSNNAAYESLDRAIQTLNKFISMGAGKSATAKDGALVAPRAPKLVDFAASVDMTKTVEDAAAVSKSLQVYLALPIEEYSLLDPRWITHGDADGIFHLQVPLYDLVGIDLTPGVTIHVEVEAEQSQVRFTATEFSSGEPTLDTEFSVCMLAVLSAGDAREVRVTRRSSSQGQTSGQTAGQTAGQSAGQTAGQTALKSFNEVELLQTLMCSVTVDGHLNVPHPLSIAPKPLLSSLGSLVLRLVLQSLLPNFMELLLVDYRRWVADNQTRDQPAGNLISG